MVLTNSRRIFTKVLKPVFSYLRSQFSHTCLGSIDDSFYLEDGYTECQEATLHTIQLLVSLGFKIHPEKSVIMSLLTKTPRELNILVQNLIHPTLDGPHPLHQRLQLMVCKLSGDPCKCLRLRQTLSKSSCICGRTAHRSSIKCILTNGCNFAVKGHMIHCIPL